MYLVNLGVFLISHVLHAKQLVWCGFAAGDVAVLSNECSTGQGARAMIHARGP